MTNPIFFGLTGIVFVALTGMLILNRNKSSVWLGSIYVGILSSLPAGLGFAAPVLYAYPFLTILGGLAAMLSGILVSYYLQPYAPNLTAEQQQVRESKNTKTLIYVSVMVVIVIFSSFGVNVIQSHNQDNLVQRSWVDVMMEFSRELKSFGQKLDQFGKRLDRLEQNDRQSAHGDSLARGLVIKNQNVIMKEIKAKRR